MPSILFIADHRLNRSPSQRYRFEQYLDFFKTNGFDWELSEIITKKDDAIFYHPGNYIKKAIILLKSIFIRFNDLRRAKQFDIIFIQREALLLGSSFFEKQFYKRSKVIFDFDDSIWLLDTSPENKKFEFLKNPAKTKINIAHAHCVIAGNKYLAGYAKQFNPNTAIIPTTIDTDFHKPMPELRGFDSSLMQMRDDKKIAIGWSGSISTIKHFESSIPFLKTLMAKYPGKLEIHVIGQASYSHPEIKIVSKSWSAKTEVEDLNYFDIGIMTLPDDEWAQGKCGLKGLSYMACGIATVMSPVGVNKDIIQQGINGFLAATESEWVDCMSQLIENNDLRQQIGLTGRETVVKNYSVNAHKDAYLEVLKSLIK
ncbi:MAG: glycosyltransferase [Burkholderiales bacterium]|nr:glycosyltransferase [Bacteroidia bacterium]